MTPSLPAPITSRLYLIVELTLSLFDFIDYVLLFYSSPEPGL